MPPSGISSYSRFWGLRQLFYSRQHIASGRFSQMNNSPEERAKRKNTEALPYKVQRQQPLPFDGQTALEMH
jgi:hypothetical protein